MFYSICTSYWIGVYYINIKICLKCTWDIFCCWNYIIPYSSRSFRSTSPAAEASVALPWAMAIPAILAGTFATVASSTTPTSVPPTPVRKLFD
ncbi:hypothetical protein HW135_002114 [Listeria monocytogenes]|nr:hypothetical protein [Listeria monocytogenes]EJV0513216.1 hypothetical protein [Listeria monocytogenes]